MSFSSNILYINDIRCILHLANKTGDSERNTIYPFFLVYSEIHS